MPHTFLRSPGPCHPDVSRGPRIQVTPARARSQWICGGLKLTFSPLLELQGVPHGTTPEARP